MPAAPTTDRLFRALAHPVRRRVIERLSRRPLTVGELAAPFDMALPSFLEHLTMLVEGGLIRSTKSGRTRTYHLVSRRLTVAETWLARQRAAAERHE